MKRNILTLAGIILLFSTAAIAQEPKFGRINLQEVVSLMPESAEAQEQLKKISDDYTSMLEMMQVEYNNKFQEYQKNQTTYSDAVKQVKERELQDLSARIQDLYNTANQELASKEGELAAPIVEKAQNAVEKIGRDNGFTIIFDESMRPMAYSNSSVVDVLPMVKKALGIPEDATPVNAAATAAAE